VLELLLAPLPTSCKHTRSSTPPFSIAATSVPRRRRVFAAAGEGQTPPPFFISPWVRQGLTELVLSQVFVPGTFRSRAPTTPECRPTRRRCQAPPPLHPLHLRSRLPLLCTVSNISRSISLLLVHFGTLTSSLERSRRPLPVPAADEARATP
jgi:hypothetical protein